MIKRFRGWVFEMMYNRSSDSEFIKVYNLVLTFLVSIDEFLDYYLDVMAAYPHEVQEMMWVKHKGIGHVRTILSPTVLIVPSTLNEGSVSKVKYHQ